MKRRTFISLMSVMAAAGVLSLAGCSSSKSASSAAANKLEAVQSNGKLVVALEGAWQPWSFHDESDTLVGYDVEVSRAIAEKLGLELQIDDMDFDAALLSVQQGKADIAMAGITVTDERMAVMSFSDSYATGIRVSELQFITIEAARCGEAVVSCKAKTRTVFLVKALRQKLLRYAAEQGIESGIIFVTRTGKPVNRTNLWREMKALCAEADVNPQKVFPHNLRHLFARVFYGIEKDIAKLADILGHSSIDTTRIYIISTGTEHRRRMENMHLIL